MSNDTTTRRPDGDDPRRDAGPAYTPPRLERLGTVAELTRGGSAAGSDGIANAAAGY